jgi:hypothetical protein
MDECGLLRGMSDAPVVAGHDRQRRAGPFAASDSAFTDSAWERRRFSRHRIGRWRYASGVRHVEKHFAQAAK